MHWWVHDYIEAGAYVELVSQIFWVLLSITLHELAHGWAAIWQGDRTPISHGRMTLNPVTHMGGMSLLMFAIVGIAWGVMPVDPSRFRWKRRGRIVVAGAGPAMNLVIAFITLTAAAGWLEYGPANNASLFRNVLTFLVMGGTLNLVLAAFNMLPVPPLDGADVLSGISFSYYRWMQSPQAQTIGFFVVIALFMSNAFDLLFTGADHAVAAYVTALVDLLPGGQVGRTPIPLP